MFCLCCILKFSFGFGCLVRHVGGLLRINHNFLLTEYHPFLVLLDKARPSEPIAGSRMNSTAGVLLYSPKLYARRPTGALRRCNATAGSFALEMPTVLTMCSSG